MCLHSFLLRFERGWEWVAGIISTFWISTKKLSISHTCTIYSFDYATIINQFAQIHIYTLSGYLFYIILQIKEACSVVLSKISTKFSLYVF